MDLLILLAVVLLLLAVFGGIYVSNLVSSDPNNQRQGSKNQQQPGRY